MFLLTRILLPVLLGCVQQSTSQSLATQNFDSLAAKLNVEISKLTSPKLEERKRIRRAIQRTGYSNVLMDALNFDGLSSLLSFIKTKLHIEYSISHRPLSVQIPIGGAKKEKKSFDSPFPARIEQIITESYPEQFWEATLHDDWTFPIDPWKKE